MVKDLILENRVTFLCLQETKCGKWTDQQISSIWDPVNHGWVDKESRGLSGGLMCSGDKSYCELLNSSNDDHWIWCTMRDKLNGKKFHIVNIYALYSQEDKQVLWEKLSEKMMLIPNEAYCLVGDFNCIRNEGERENCSYRRRDMESFNNFIGDMNLMEMDISNSQFTWFGPRGKRSKLDRALVSADWLELGEWQIKTLGRKKSDHKPLLLYIESIDWGLKPFKVFNCWLKEASLKSLLGSFLDLNPNALRLDAQSLIRRYKSLIKEWSRDPNHNVDTRLKRLEVQQGVLDADPNKFVETAGVREE